MTETPNEMTVETLERLRDGKWAGNPRQAREFEEMAARVTLKRAIAQITDTIYEQWRTTGKLL